MPSPAELLRRYAQERSEDAFAAVVREHVDLVYSAALRQVGGDAHLARDVTQAVFLALAKSASALAQRGGISGWLYVTTRNLAAKAVREQQRRRAREEQAAMWQESEYAAAPEPVWEQLRPVIDDALCALGASDREAILLRYFEDRAFAEIGARTGVNENAARMRVERALEKLRAQLARRGITSTAAALGAAISAHAVSAAPAGLAASISGALGGLAIGGGAGALAGGAIQLFAMTPLKAGIVGAAIATGAWVAVQQYTGETEPPSAGRDLAAESSLREEIERYRRENEHLRAQADAALAARREADAAAERIAAARENTAATAAGPREISTLQRLDVLADLQEGQVIKATVRTIDRSGKLDEAFAGLFGLAPAEREALQAALDRTRHDLGQLELANATMRQTPDGKYVIQVTPFAAQGGEVYNALLDSFAATLGPERNRAFLSLASDDLEKALGGMGAQERVVTVKPGPDPKNPTSKYIVEDRQVFPGGSSSRSHGVKDRANVDQYVGSLSSLLPAEL